MLRTSAFLIAAAVTANAWAQVPCQTYKEVYQTVNEQRQVTAYKVENEIVYDAVKRTTMRPVYETQTRQRTYTVARPVTETSTREERYQVMKPVWETQVRDTSYDVVRQVPETSAREERYTVLRPQTINTERVQRQVVLRPVTETAERDEISTVMEQQTTYRTNYVDQGGYVEQQVVTPGEVRNRLQMVPSTCVVDPLTGLSVQQPGGLFWVPEKAPDRVSVYRAWQPNPVAVQVPETTLVPRTVTRKVQVPVTRYQEEVIEQTIPVQVTQMVPVEESRTVQVTSYKTVTERVPQQTSYQVCKMEVQEMVRPITVTTQRVELVQQTEDYQVQVCKLAAFEETVNVPRVVRKVTPVVYTQSVPRTIVMRVPVECGCCGSTVSTLGYAPQVVTGTTVIGQPTPVPGVVRTSPVDKSPDSRVKKNGATGADVNPSLNDPPSPDLLKENPTEGPKPGPVDATTGEPNEA